MAYSTFLVAFLGPPLALVAVLTWRDERQGRALTLRGRARPGWILLLHVLLALMYTSPWDNYLVAAQVWWYEPSRVLGVRLGSVPLEEYAFFVLQALLTGLWLLWLARRPQLEPLPAPGRPHLRLRTSLLAGLLWPAAVALLLARRRPFTYLALQLAWALPPLCLQLGFGADILSHRRRLVFPAVAVPSIYLAVADALAITSGTWTIDPTRCTGLRLGGVLPAEELIFFTLTNTLIVFGMTLALTLESWRRLPRCSPFRRRTSKAPVGACQAEDSGGDP